MELTHNETLELLGELEVLIEDVYEVRDRETRFEQIELVFDSLEDAPSSSVQECLSQIRGWAEVLMAEEERPEEAASAWT